MSRRVRSPGWLDLRLVAGVVLVLVCVLIGVRLVASADHTTRFWTAGHDLAPGVVLQASDLRAVSVRLPAGSSGSGRYFPAAASVVGQAVNRQIAAGELVPRSALGPADAATTVTIPLGGDNAPKIAAGQRITVWVSTKLCASAVVLSDVAVQSVQGARTGSLGASGGTDVVVRLTPTLALRVIQALALDGGVLRAGIVDGPGPASTGLPDLSRCGASGS